ncbi:recombinase [Pelobium manganitolerans]|uniref:Recombinase n=1 Tax=Pelobium manganitolerans TaxID=1842495 RepID=A0A419S7N3_9SPHI|nr:site-specific integrase [Pelobium manganitolerans]RKD12764.1 recombinase [Pelobium manganitolerans]RKD16348.1 recombinase [Pelobium manganitolerans]RKD17507.1 recombinase [Pelobium manganitolerans]RKD19633.1 recombinase [Pelobium manganitolerans]
MSTLVQLHFYLKTPKAYTGGPMPVYCRITAGGKRTEISLNRKCEPSKWSKKTCRATGNREPERMLNRCIDQLQVKIYDAQEFLSKNNETISTMSLRDKILGTTEKVRTILGVFEEHNSKVEALTGKEFAAGTLERYRTSFKHTADFIQWKYRVKDMDIRKIDHQFITEYDFYLRTVRSCANNTAVKYIKNFGKIIRICLANGWITVNPMLNYKPKVKKVDRVFLTAEELDALSNKEFRIERVAQVRDVFVFSCYTGLAYADVKKLKKEEIIKGVDGHEWIYTHRQKTDVASRIPLLPPAKKILQKYEDHPKSIAEGTVLPVLSNQKMNAYLKEIADTCGIEKELTYHIARHTFATTVTLLNDVPIETVSKMLGHSSIKMTQHYAKILDVKIGRDMAHLREKFS